MLILSAILARPFGSLTGSILVSAVAEPGNATAFAPVAAMHAQLRDAEAGAELRATYEEITVIQDGQVIANYEFQQPPATT